MKITGIICEYNPFHNGHRYHIEETRKRFGPDYIIGIMSGNFTQRGTPAIVDKYSRTRMALSGGCDLVIELPVRYATSSAEGFASAAVNTLVSTGVCDSISFGSEHGNLDILRTIAGILHDDPEEFSGLLSTYLKRGEPFPKARELALKDYTGYDLDDIFEPNNILAIEYLKACIGTNITPYTIKRTDKGYHSASYVPGGAASTFSLLAAEEIRKIIFKNTNLTNPVSEFIPEYTADNLCDPVCPEKFASVIYYSIMNNTHNLEQYVDISGNLADRIRNNINRYTGIDSFISLIKSKNLTYTRIERALIHCLLGIKKLESFPHISCKYPIPYIRILGFRKTSSALMKLIQTNAKVPVITKPARTQELDTLGTLLLSEDIRAAEIYNHVRYLGSGHADNKLNTNEFTHGIIIL